MSQNNAKEIIFLGTGAADVTKYFNSCFYVKDGESGLLVDTGGGNGILTQLEKSNIPLEEIRYIYLTHKHIDHLLGIFWILRILGSKISKGKAENLTIFCSESLSGVIKEMSYKLLKKKVTDLFGTKILFDIITNDKEIDINNWKIQCFDIQSTKDEQYGFRLEFADEKTFVNLGDEPYNDKLEQYAKNSDYILHDAFCLEDDRDIFNPQKINHATVKEAATNAANLETKNLILFHSEDKKTFGKRKELYSAEAKESFSGNVFVPDDLESIPLN